MKSYNILTKFNEYAIPYRVATLMNDMSIKVNSKQNRGIKMSLVQQIHDENISRTFFNEINALLTESQVTIYFSDQSNVVISQGSASLALTETHQVVVYIDVLLSKKHIVNLINIQRIEGNLPPS